MAVPPKPGFGTGPLEPQPVFHRPDALGGAVRQDGDFGIGAEVEALAARERVSQSVGDYVASGQDLRVHGIGDRCAARSTIFAKWP